MAVSTLAEIDWTNLDSAEMTTAVRLLAHATQERFNIAMMRMNGTFLTVGDPDDNDKSNYFPFENNSPIWSLEGEDGPLINFSSPVEQLIDRMIDNFADIAKWNTADTNSEISTTRYTLSMAANAPGTYDNRLFELIGDTSNTYPDLSVYAPEEVKKWYDMLAECSYVLRQHGEDNDDYMIFDGSFDVEQDTFFAADEDGANFFGIDKTTYEAVGNTTPYSDFKTEQAALFGTLPDQFDESVDSGTFPPDPYWFPFWIRVARLAATGNYISWTKCWQVTYVADWVDSRAAVGFNGRPLSYKNQHAINNLNNNFPSGEDTNFVFPASTTAVDERYYTTNVVTEVSDKDEIAVDHDLSAVTVPTNITDISAGQSVETQVDFGNILTNWFLEDWDGDGGFDSYI